jgi:hypothetical protein
LRPDGEVTWQMQTTGRRLVPFPINLYDSREGLPHEWSTGAADKPVPGLEPMTVSKNGVMNLVEIDMGNLGRMLKGDFDKSLFTDGHTTPIQNCLRASCAQSFGYALISSLQISDNGGLLYISDRRG